MTAPGLHYHWAQTVPSTTINLSNHQKKKNMDASEFKVTESLTATGNTADLTDREKHLIGLAVVLTRGCEHCTGGRMEKAIAAGIGYDTLRATVDLSAAVNAGVVLRTAIQGAEKNQIDEKCEGTECAVGLPEKS
ncbi:MAG: carboxymuconolactone decarboxylase family protein [Verrucomicrobiota bacterium]